MRSYLLLYILCSFYLVSFTQEQTAAWYFGEFAGLKFDEDTVNVVVDGQINTFEGTSSICDRNGKLLFYTDGSVVWNKNHMIMTNGSGLLGDPSSTQSSLILPKPGSDSLYYIFTTDKFGYANGLRYSIVDMTLSGGKGAVISLNNLLHTPVAEKLTAVLHSNRKDYWIVSHEWNSNNYLAFKLTASGVDSIPVISSIGSFIGPSVGEACGYLKSTPQGTLLANAGCDLKNLQIFHFDKDSGKISDLITVPFTQPIYGLEFSNSEKYLYLSSWAGNKIYRLDLTYWYADSITNSKISFNGIARAMQQGLDGKIYTANNNSTHVGVILNADSSAAKVVFNDTFIELNGRRSQWGLPNFAPSFFRTNAISISGFCEGDTTSMSAGNENADSIRWFTGDGATYRGFDVRHLYPAPDNYLLKVVFYNSQNDTIQQQVKIEADPKFVNWSDSTICSNQSIVISIDSAYQVYWSDSVIDYHRSFNNSTFKWVEYNSSECIFRDSFTISVQVKASHNISDTTFCFGDSVKLALSLPSYTIVWNDSIYDSAYVVSNTELVHFSANNGTCDLKDSILISETQKSKELILDRSVCNSYLVAIEDTTIDQIMWYDLDTNRSKLIIPGGPYWIYYHDGMCNYIDSFYILKVQPPDVDLNDTSICSGESLVYTKEDSIKWLWSDGQSGSTVMIQEGGTYNISVWNNCDTLNKTISVQLNYCECGFYIPNAFSPNSDGKNDLLQVYSNCSFNEYHFSVYDRWGSKIYESSNPSKGWDGTYKSRESSPGTYSFVLKYSLPDRGLRTQTGTIHLIR